MSERRTILVVDDEPGMRAGLAAVLGRGGFTVDVATTGEDGLARLLQGGIDLLVTDLRLPVMDGVELLKRAKALGQDVEVIMITGHGTVEIAVEAIKEGAYDFITKPVKKAQLLRAVEKAAEKQYLSRENRQLRQQRHHGRHRAERALFGPLPFNLAHQAAVASALRTQPGDAPHWRRGFHCTGAPRG